MSQISSFLAQHHRDCDEVYVAAEAAVSGGDWTAAREKSARFGKLLLGHFSMEEEVLFPAFEGATGMAGGPPAMMRLEHTQMRAMLTALDGALEKKDAKAWLSAGESLLMMIQQHNMKEEGILYPMTDRALEGQAAALLGQMSAVLNRA